MPDTGATYPTWEQVVTAPTEPTTAPAAPAQPIQPTPPVHPAAPSVPTPAQVFPQQQPQQPTQAARPVGEHGYPENTPLAEMTDKEQAAYHKYHSRRWQQRAEERADYDEVKAKAAEFDKLQAANQTEMQRAVAEAEQRARAATIAEVGGQLAGSALRTSLTLTNRLSREQIDALLAPLDTKAFLTADGLNVDADKVTAYVNVVAPPVAPATPAAPAAVPPAPAAPATGTPQPRPDMGQGNRTAPPSGGLAAGAERARARVASRQAPPVIAK